MAAKAEDPPLDLPPSSPNPTLDLPPVSSTTAESLAGQKDRKFNKDDEAEEEEEKRETKRRRTTCHLVVDKDPANSQAEERVKAAAAGGFSFSFDARAAPAVETTPKFGSFNSAIEKNMSKAGKEEEEDGESKFGDWAGGYGVYKFIFYFIAVFNFYFKI